jgi:hypothetical protein
VIVGEQITDRDLAFMLDIGVAADDGVFVERDLRDTLITARHGFSRCRD